MLPLSTGNGTCMYIHYKWEDLKLSIPQYFSFEWGNQMLVSKKTFSFDY